MLRTVGDNNKPKLRPTFSCVFIFTLSRPCNKKVLPLKIFDFSQIIIMEFLDRLVELTIEPFQGQTFTLGVSSARCCPLVVLPTKRFDDRIHKGTFA